MEESLRESTAKDQAKIKPILDKFLPSQLAAWEHVKASRHPVVLIRGPAGSGKTEFSTSLGLISNKLNINANAAAARNLNVDDWCRRIVEKDPTINVMRGHSHNPEMQALQRAGDAFGRRAVLR